MKVLMLPHITQFGRGEGGVRRVVEAYNKYLPQFGIELVNPDTFSYDLTAVHAGVAPGADVAHNHGLYWTADLQLSDYEWQANTQVINSLREARQITVPSQWVAESIRRDMRINPHVIPHGVEWDEWQGSGDDGGYVLWNKNRDFDVCNPEAIIRLARIFREHRFMSTFASNPSPNLKVTGQVPYEQMRQMVLGCSVYLSSIKETFGIGTLEAMAAGKPVLGWANGGNLDLVQHGVNGYLAQPDNYDDLANGLEYCLAHQRTLGDNGREMAKKYTWREVSEQVARVYEAAYSDTGNTVGVVIPLYNKTEDEIVRAITSCLNQSYMPDQIIVVNDGSTDTSGFAAISEKFSDVAHLSFVSQSNQGVAVARNAGVKMLTTELVSCLDGDDWYEPEFLLECRAALMENHTIGIAYTGLRWHDHEEGKNELSTWPGAYQAAKQFDHQARQNQVPTACVFRRDAWERVGGYRSRYCPDGAGSEDAALWTQILSIGYTAKQVTTEPLFNYSLGGQVSANKEYKEIDWLAWLPFSRDKRYPFACSVLPERYSHPVRQYDEPEISIVIPVGPGHEHVLRTALDSIEAQHFRNWEVIVVFDTGNEYYPELYAAYPYVKWENTRGKRGPGYARNQGAEIAKGKFLLFLDADDFLNPGEPNALGEMLAEFWETGNGIYSAHIGRATISPEYAKKMERENRLVAWNENLGQAYISNPGIEFDCERAFLEPRDHPDGKFFIWNLVSTLIPRQWHFDIGGFDEHMPTWEDWDYWLRMAKGGRCFTRIQKPFVIYNYISGNLRETGLQIGNEVLQYLKEKHEDIKIMACGCGNKRMAGEIVATSEGYVEAWYLHGNTGNHDVTVSGHRYGRHPGGRRVHFPVLAEHVKANPRLFEEYAQIVSDPEPQPEAMPEPVSIAPPPPPEEAPVEIDLSELKPQVQDMLRSKGLTTVDMIDQTGYDNLLRLDGIGPATAKKIMELAE
ncbi:hypothetical protein LCGC14_1376360 [marine sediment metagenome]|uniref:Glycosyltransferase 2-like domain-containing protein n=2 Tax=marine sediment metagenome TaxID=412755 RepID=A0A0F9MJA1_9ZZZZ